ncbi:uncharacterized protein LOC129981696 [Argiope bruennichi]|uniref:uncharacterized protein LOC129981696 n=1 Tax=Argiope bruennichi TaxID=94029 RepID=UPI0024949438|nr:uncharacterized protein LOC129981696 [Argiope bruennichi]
MDELSKLRKTRGLHRSSVTKYINKINSDLEEKIDSLTTKDLQEALNYLNISSTQLKDYDKLIQNLIKDDKEFETEIESAFEYNEKIIVCLSKLSAQLKCLQDESERQSITPNVSLLGATGNPNLDAINNTQESSAIVPVNEYNFKTIKLPKLTIEKYYGDPCCWLEFWNQFQNSIDNNKSLSKIDKFSYLKSLLGGAAAIAVNGFALSDENYDQALKLLKQRFGREELVINAHMSKLLNLVPVTDSNNIYGLRKLYDTVEINLRSLESLKVTSEMYGHLLYPILIKLIPEDLVLEFNRKKVDNSVKFEFNVTELLNFLRIEIECRESSMFMHTAKGDKRKENSLPKAKQNPFNNFSRNTDSSHDILRSPRSSAKPKDLQCFSASALNENCLYCKGEHRSELCSQTDLETKLGVLKQDGRCFLCLKPKHRVNECRQRRYLTCEICGKKHNKSICSQAESNTPDLNKDNKNVITAISHYDKNKTNFSCGNIFLQTCAALVRNDETNEFETVRLMLDNGSMRTFITREVSEKLKLKVIRKESLSVYSFGAKQAKEHSYNIVRVELKNREDPSLSIEVEALVTENISATTLPAPNNNITKTYNKLKPLQLADIIDYRGKNISILIGVDYYYEIVSGRIKRLNNKLVTTETIFGWCLQGHVGLSNDLMTMKIVVDEKDISDQLKQFWDLENLGVEGVEEDDFEKHTVDKEIMKQFEENIVYQNKRYTVKFPWKTNMKEYLANNFKVSKRRFSHLKSKFIKDNSLFLDYKAVIEDHLKEGIIKKVITCEEEKPSFYLPHRAVIREDKTTTRLRVVFDASSHAKGQLSLNDCLHTGINLIPDLFEILIGFREQAVAITADIKKAFLQIQIAEEDQNYTSFFWTEDPEKEEEEIFKMTRVLFGVKSSPFLLAATIQHHLKRWSLIQSLRSKFWKRWSQEYLNSLQSRAKWKLPELNIKPGQLVLLKDNSKSPMEWNLARIERIYPGTDGLVRVADIRTPKGIFRRSINRLCPLPFEEGFGQLSNGGRDVPS